MCCKNAKLIIIQHKNGEKLNTVKIIYILKIVLVNNEKVFSSFNMGVAEPFV